MKPSDDGTPSKLPREQTDESLRAERHVSDTHVLEKLEAVDQDADEVLRIARERADEVVESERADADRLLGAEAAAGQDGPTGELARAAELVEYERASADKVVQEERADADLVIEHERAERRRVMADFLAVERETTDKDLIGERDHADTAVAGRDELLATVSHDLSSLLNGLSLSAGLLARSAPEGPVGDAMRRHGSTSERLVVRMSRLINDLLDLASIEAGGLSIHAERVPVRELLRETLAAFEPIAADKRVTLDIDAVPQPIEVELDSGRILQVLANLVSNAIKFTPAGGRVSIGCRAECGEVQFAVRDNGIGIPEDALGLVFERFRQVSKDRRGLGLGLHISKGIVEAHGGRLWVESKPAAGSTFHFALPATPGRANH